MRMENYVAAIMFFLLLAHQRLFEKILWILMERDRKMMINVEKRSSLSRQSLLNIVQHFIFEWRRFKINAESMKKNEIHGTAPCYCVASFARRIKTMWSKKKSLSSALKKINCLLQRKRYFNNNVERRVSFRLYASLSLSFKMIKIYFNEWPFNFSPFSAIFVAARSFTFKIFEELQRA